MYTIKEKSFSKTFFPYCIDKWNKLNSEIKNINLKKSIITQKLENSFYKVHDPIGVKLLLHLRLQFTRLTEHQLSHSCNHTVIQCVPVELM